MYKRLFCLFFVITTLLACSFSAFGDEVIAEPIDYDVILTAHSLQSGRYFYQDASANTVYQVAAQDGNYLLSSTGISFNYDDTTAFVPGATYVMTFVFVTPQQSINTLEGTNIGVMSGPVSGEQDIIIGTNATVTKNFDRSLYPDTFNFPYLNYNSESYLVTYSFKLEPGDSYFGIAFDFDIASKNYTFFSSGYSHLSIKTTQEQFNNGILLNINYFLNNINKLLGDVLRNITQGFNLVNSTLTSLQTTTSDGFSGVLASLSSLRSDINSGFDSLGEKLDDLNDNISDALQGDIDQAVGDLNQADQNMQQGSSDIKNEQNNINNSVDDLTNQFEQNEAVQDSFLNDYNLGGLSSITGNIYAAIREYSKGIEWVGSFFGVVLTFEPFAYLMYIIVFINFLFIMLNSSSRAFGSMVRRNTYEERAMVRAEKRAEVNAHILASRQNQVSMFNHYGFTR